MSIDNLSLSDIAAVTGNNDNFGNGNGWWIILLFLFMGWGNRGFGGNGSAGGDMLYPFMNQAQNTWTGFSQVQQDLCGGFANAETAATARQMADMQQMFGLSQQLSQCCCENRLATANLAADIAREACADRQAVSEALQTVVTTMNNGIQTILNKLSDQDLYAERRENERLRQELAMASLASSQTSQTATILAAIQAQKATTA